MSEIMIKQEIRKYIRTSGFEVSSKMICPIVKLFNMRYKNIDSKQIVSLANIVINETK